MSKVKEDKEAKDLEKLTQEINAILASSAEMQVKGEDQFKEGLSKMIDSEKNRKDITVVLRDLKPQPIKKGLVRIEFGGKSYQWNRFALGQYMVSQNINLRMPTFNLLKEMEAIDVEGNKIKNVDLAQNYLMGVPLQAGEEATKIARIEKITVKGLLGNNYPLPWLDSLAIKGIAEAATEIVNKVQLKAPIINGFNGSSQFALTFPDLEKDVNPEVGDIVRAGSYYRNNPYGYGSMDTGFYLDRLNCENGSTSRIPLFSSLISHQSKRVFNSEMYLLCEKYVPDLLGEDEEISKIAEAWKLGGKEFGEFEYTEIYRIFGKAVVTQAKESFETFMDLIETARSFRVKDYKNEIVAQAIKAGVKSEKVHFLLLELANQDPTVDTDSFTHWDTANVFSRVANKTNFSHAQRMRYQDISSSILTEKPLTPLIKS